MFDSAWHVCMYIPMPDMDTPLYCATSPLPPPPLLPPAPDKSKSCKDLNEWRCMCVSVTVYVYVCKCKCVHTYIRVCMSTCGYRYICMYM